MKLKINKSTRNTFLILLVTGSVLMLVGMFVKMDFSRTIDDDTYWSKWNIHQIHSYLRTMGSNANLFQLHTSFSHWIKTYNMNPDAHYGWTTSVLPLPILGLRVRFLMAIIGAYLLISIFPICGFMLFRDNIRQQDKEEDKK